MTIAAEKGTGTTSASTRPATDQAGPANGKSETGGEKTTRPVLTHDKRRALGRGLESLLPGPRTPSGSPGSVAHRGDPQVSVQKTDANLGHPSSSSSRPPAASGAHVPGDGAAVPETIPDLQALAARHKPEGHEVLDVPIDLVDVNPHQTRSWTKWEIEALDELADSIKAQGVLQPITVRPGKDGRYVLITGERRMRACTMAGQATVPAIVRVVSEQQAAEMTVIENLQRRDLTCIDLARAYIMLSKNFNLTQEQIGERVGVARETVSNYMRLAKLPEMAQHYLQMGQLEFSHARILLNLQDPEVIAKVAHKAATENMSVEKLESFVLFDPSMAAVKKNLPKPASGGARWVDPNVRAAQRELERILGVKVRIRDRKGKGKITLEYSTLEDFDRVVEMLTGKN
ncbi:MAG: chromosome partitioning protein ParB [Acidobacteria bacterium]|nr:MAG: chromosome partitioning protein ParB [Acidobacteriota bacterium]